MSEFQSDRVTPIVPDFLRLPIIGSKLPVVTDFHPGVPPDAVDLRHVAADLIFLGGGAEGVGVICDSRSTLLPGTYVVPNHWLGEYLKLDGPAYLMYDGLESVIAGMQAIRGDYNFAKRPLLRELGRMSESIVWAAYDATWNPLDTENNFGKMRGKLLDLPSSLDRELMETIDKMVEGTDLFDRTMRLNPRRIPLQMFAVMDRLDRIGQRIEKIDLLIEQRILAITDRLDAILEFYAVIKRTAGSPLRSEELHGRENPVEAREKRAFELEDLAEIMDLIPDRPIRRSARRIAEDLRLAAAAYRDNNLQFAANRLQCVENVCELVIDTLPRIIAIRLDLGPIVKYDAGTTPGYRELMAAGIRSTIDLLQRRDYDAHLQGAKPAERAKEWLLVAARDVSNGDMKGALKAAKKATEAY